MCKFCEIKPVIKLISGKNLCKSCFIKYFEKKVFKTVGKYKLIDKKDKIAVAVGSGKDSFTVLYLLNELAKKRMDLDITALAIDGGIEGYRDLRLLEKYCKENKIKLKVVSFKKEFGYTLDEILKKLKVTSYSVYGVFRRSLLNKYARELGVNKLATGHNLDDEAQSILMNYYRDTIEVSARLGPITGVIKDPRFVVRIKPLYFLTEKETALYALLKKFPVIFRECPNSLSAYRGHVRDMLNEFEAKHPGTKYAIINSFLELLPSLKAKYREEIKSCKKCKEPSSSEVCKVCQLRDKLRK